MYRQVDHHADPDGRRRAVRPTHLEIVITIAVIVLLTVLVLVVQEDASPQFALGQGGNFISGCKCLEESNGWVIFLVNDSGRSHTKLDRIYAGEPGC
jgi:hypothetical protein